MKHKAVYVLFILLTAFACVLCVWQAIVCHEEEVAEQVAQLGYYKEDVYLDYGKHALKTAYVWGAVLFGIATLSQGAILALLWKK